MYFIEWEQETVTALCIMRVNIKNYVNETMIEIQNFNLNGFDFQPSLWKSVWFAFELHKINEAQNNFWTTSNLNPTEFKCYLFNAWNWNRVNYPEFQVNTPVEKPLCLKTLPLKYEHCIVDEWKRHNAKTN